jgi:Flp pilus assembly protein TadG
MAEFAIVMPILILVLFGIIQFGIVFNNYVALTDAARAGARKGAVSRNDPVGAQTACQNQVFASRGNLDPKKLNATCSSSNNWQPGSDVQVTASYPYSLKLFGIPITNGFLTTVMKERVE